MKNIATIEQSVRIAFRENHKAYINNYPATDGGNPTAKACANALDFADSIYHLREVAEEQEEIKAGVAHLSQYEDWVISELKELAKK